MSSTSKTLIVGTWQFNYILDDIIRFVGSESLQPQSSLPPTGMKISFVVVGEDDRSHMNLEHLDSLSLESVDWNGVELVGHNKITR